MCKPARIDVLRLYKNLLRYGQTLKYTDQNYFYQRVRTEFMDNKQATLNKLNFSYKRGETLLKLKRSYFQVRLKIKYDRSKVPVLDENDLEEKFIKGGGPGGQKINKSNNCVSLFHKPTGIVVKCQLDRDREQNRKIARDLLITKLDNLWNKEDSIENQKKEILQKKSLDRKRKREKLRELRESYKSQNEKDVNKNVS